MSDIKTFVIIDGNAIIHRAYHALPPMTTTDGTVVHAVYGFTSMLLKVMADLKPDYLAVSFDVSGKTFRDDLYTAYKATRVKADQDLYDQIPLVYQVVEAFGIPIYTKKGFEADDVIGTIVSKLGNDEISKLDAVIVTGDMDMLQLVDEHTKVYELRKGLSDIVLFDPAKVKEKYGFGPEHIVDYKAFRGDVSDNIPGIKGIGEKTATELIQKYGGIDDMYKQIRDEGLGMREKLRSSVFKKLQEGEKDARMSYELATIRRDVTGLDFSLDACAVRPIDRERVVKLFQRFEFPSLLRRLPGEAPEPKKMKEKSKSKSTEKKLVMVSQANVENFFSVIQKQSIVCAREILSGADILTSDLRGFVVIVGAVPYYVDFTQLNKAATENVLHLFTDEKRLWIGHDIKQLVKAVLGSGGLFAGELFDVMIASYVINASSRVHDLRGMALRELAVELPGGTDQTSLFGADPTAVASELRVVYSLYEKYVGLLKERNDSGLFHDIEMKLIPVLAEMELNGIAVDLPLLHELSKEVARDIENVSKKIWKEAGEEFNIASNNQLRDILFEKMKLPIQGVKKGKTGFSTAASELDKLRGLHPVIEMIEEHRELSKLQNTYIDVLPTLVNKKTGRIHTSFNQAVAATGRLSSSDPNLQNIPIRTELGKRIRDAFIAEDGYVLLSADYSQIELRIVASLAEDEKMIEIFNAGKDIHAATAAAINGVPLEKVTKEMRYGAKEVNFGVLYGMGAYGLSSRTGISQGEAQEFIKKYFEQFAGVKKYVDQTIKFAREEGYVETLFGRRRSIPELKADNFQLRAAGERMAVNMPIQGTAADLMKMAMIAVHEKLKAKSYKLKASMILQVHDELVLEVKKGLEDEVGSLVKEAMENVVKLRVPIEVHVSCGRRWGELK